MTRDLLLVAAGGLAREVLAAVRTRGAERVVGYLDDQVHLHGSVIDGVAVLGGLEDAVVRADVSFVVCAGRGRARESIVARLEEMGIGPERFATVVHPGVVVPEGSSVGAGSILLAGVVLTAGVQVGAHVVAMPNVTLTHDTVVADFATLCAGVSLGGGVVVGRSAYVGMNVSVREHVRIGERAIVGMGAALLSDVPDRETWAGVPATRRETTESGRHRMVASELLVPSAPGIDPWPPMPPMPPMPSGPSGRADRFGEIEGVEDVGVEDRDRTVDA